MRSQNLIFMLFMLVIMPFTLLISSHDTFFILVSSILAIVSIKNIYFSFFAPDPASFRSDDELNDELEHESSIDANKINRSLNIIRNLVLILFFFYCALYLTSKIQTVMAAALILYWVNNTVNIITAKKYSFSIGSGRMTGVFFILINFCTLIFLIIVTFNKFGRL